MLVTEQQSEKLKVYKTCPLDYSAVTNDEFTNLLCTNKILSNKSFYCTSSNCTLPKTCYLNPPTRFENLHESTSSEPQTSSKLVQNADSPSTDTTTAAITIEGYSPLSTNDNELHLTDFNSNMFSNNNLEGLYSYVDVEFQRHLKTNEHTSPSLLEDVNKTSSGFVCKLEPYIEYKNSDDQSHEKNLSRHRHNKLFFDTSNSFAESAAENLPHSNSTSQNVVRTEDSLLKKCTLHNYKPPHTCNHSSPETSETTSPTNNSASVMSASDTPYFEIFQSGSHELSFSTCLKPSSDAKNSLPYDTLTSYINNQDHCFSVNASSHENNPFMATYPLMTIKEMLLPNNFSDDSKNFLTTPYNVHDTYLQFQNLFDTESLKNTSHQDHTVDFSYHDNTAATVSSTAITHNTVDLYDPQNDSTSSGDLQEASLNDFFLSPNNPHPDAAKQYQAFYNEPSNADPNCQNVSYNLASVKPENQKSKDDLNIFDDMISNANQFCNYLFSNTAPANFINQHPVYNPVNDKFNCNSADSTPLFNGNTNPNCNYNLTQKNALKLLQSIQKQQKKKNSQPNNKQQHQQHLTEKSSNTNQPRLQLSLNRNGTEGPTFWGMWEDERSRMVYVSWLPKAARARDRNEKKKCELSLKHFISKILGFQGLQKVLLFPPSSAHCKLLFDSEDYAKRFLSMFGGLETDEGPSLWKSIVCKYYSVLLFGGICSTRVRIIWADQTKNDVL